MRVSAMNNQQIYNKNLTFEGRGKLGNKHYGRKGAVIGGITGLMMCGAMIATCPIDWRQIKTWPIVGVALTTAGTLNGKLIGELMDKKKEK